MFNRQNEIQGGVGGGFSTRLRLRSSLVRDIVTKLETDLIKSFVLTLSSYLIYPTSGKTCSTYVQYQKQNSSPTRDELSIRSNPVELVSDISSLGGIQLLASQSKSSIYYLHPGERVMTWSLKECT
jgi:hypothetical protein